MDEKKRLTIYLMDGDARSKIQSTFDKLENELQIDGLGTVITTAMLELVENAVKANLKRVFFNQNGYKFDDSDSYNTGMKAFVASYKKVQTTEFRNALRDLELMVVVDIDRNGKRLIIYVENNTILLAREEARIRKQLSAAMSMEKLLDFYFHYGDETEGSGLGLAMIVFLIRSLGFDPQNFRVFTRGKKTIARLEFPMEADYIPIREQYQSIHRTQ